MGAAAAGNDRSTDHEELLGLYEARRGGNRLIITEAVKGATLAWAPAREKRAALGGDRRPWTLSKLSSLLALTED